MIVCKSQYQRFLSEEWSKDEFSEYEKFIPVIGVMLYIIVWLECNKYL